MGIGIGDLEQSFPDLRVRGSGAAQGQPDRHPLLAPTRFRYLTRRVDLHRTRALRRRDGNGEAPGILCFLIVRRRGVYFAMVTIAFGQVLIIAYSWNDFTGGFDGLRGFERAPIGLGPIKLDITSGGPTFYDFLLAVFAVAVTLMGLLLRSPFGRTLLAIREKWNTGASLDGSVRESAHRAAGR